jgi:hypothetical protein
MKLDDRGIEALNNFLSTIRPEMRRHVIASTKRAKDDHEAVTSPVVRDAIALSKRNAKGQLPPLPEKYK